MRRRRTDDDFEDGVLRDGHVARVSMLARDGSDDGLTPLQRAVARDSAPHWNEDRRRRQTRKFDPKGRLISTSEEEEEMEDAIPRRPGFTRDALDAIEAAYQEVELRDSEAWRHLASHGATSDGPRAGDECTVREGGGKYGVEGSPGRLREIDGKLVCVSTDHHDAMPEPTGDAQLDAAYARAFAITDAVERAYEMRRLDDENAWRKP
jgi:hypothetical protein